MITDTHTHLYSEQFDQDRALMVQRAKDAGIHRFFYPCYRQQLHRKNVFIRNAIS